MINLNNSIKETQMQKHKLLIKNNNQGRNVWKLLGGVEIKVTGWKSIKKYFDLLAGKYLKLQAEEQITELLKLS